MPENLGLYVMLVLALGIGFLLGRRERGKPREEQLSVREYFVGLNHLLNDREDLAIDTFVERIGVDPATIDTHLALGALVRRRGEVDKAIRIHQSLLSRPVLSADHRARTELELAQDYLSAGLLDRAESLLTEIVRKSAGNQKAAMALLLEVYERESDWSRAAEVAGALGRDTREWQGRLAQYHCELAAAALAAKDHHLAREKLSAALRADARCARAYLLGAELDLASGRLKDVFKQCRRFVELTPALAGEALPLFEAAAGELGRTGDYVQFLEHCSAQGGDVRVALALFEHLRQSEGDARAQTYAVSRILSQPGLAGFVALIKQLDANFLSTEQIEQIRDYAADLLDKQFDYRCSNCGFGAHQLLWHCPSCRHWATLLPITELKR